MSDISPMVGFSAQGAPRSRRLARAPGHLASGHRRLVDDVERRPLPYLDEGMLRPPPPPPVSRVSPPAPSRPVEIPEQVLRIFVGDLAPQVSGALNFVQTNKLANTGAALGSVVLGALIIPALVK